MLRHLISVRKSNSGDKADFESTVKRLIIGMTARIVHKMGPA